MPHSTHGTLVLMGSGEMAPSMVEVHKYAMSLVEGQVQAAFIATPAGFQLNADALAEKAVAYFESSLNTALAIIPLKNTQSIAESELREAMQALYEANYTFAGPGSPTYALQQWKNTPVPDALLETLSRGGCLVFASAAALTVGRLTIPVYEVYKVGEDLHWVEGMNLLAHHGLDVIVVPHWNNNSGGDHDTRYCFMGEPRWQVLFEQLPDSAIILGIDEHTACILRLDANIADVRGVGQVTVIRDGQPQVFSDGQTLSLDLLRPALRVDAPVRPTAQANGSPSWASIREQHEALLRNNSPSPEQVTQYVFNLLKLMDAARQCEDWPIFQQVEDALREALITITGLLNRPAGDPRAAVAPYVDLLLGIRTDLRGAKQWAYSDRIRDDLDALGITIADSPEGSSWSFSNH